MRIFRDDHDFQSFMNVLNECKIRIPFTVYHFALMTNHIHLVMSPDADDSLPDIMQRIGYNYSIYHKYRYGFEGRLWQGNYKKYLITTYEYLLTCGIYVELNPVRAGLVSSPAEYRWSSHRFYVSASEWDFMEPSPNFLCMGKDQAERKEMYEELVKMWQELPPTKKAARAFFRGGAEGFHPGVE